MSSSLRRLIKKYKGKKFEDGTGIARKGKLTDARIDAVQIFITHHSWQ